MLFLIALLCTIVHGEAAAVSHNKTRGIQWTNSEPFVRSIVVEPSRLVIDSDTSAEQFLCLHLVNGYATNMNTTDHLILDKNCLEGQEVIEFDLPKRIVFPYTLFLYTRRIYMDGIEYSSSKSYYLQNPHTIKYNPSSNSMGVMESRIPVSPKTSNGIFTVFLSHAGQSAISVLPVNVTMLFSEEITQNVTIEVFQLVNARIISLNMVNSTLVTLQVVPNRHDVFNISIEANRLVSTGGNTNAASSLSLSYPGGIFVASYAGQGPLYIAINVMYDHYGMAYCMYSLQEATPASCTSIRNTPQVGYEAITPAGFSTVYMFSVLVNTTYHVYCCGMEAYDVEMSSTIESTHRVVYVGSLECPIYESRICAGHGVCYDGMSCECEPGYYGGFCSKSCPGLLTSVNNRNNTVNIECSGHGMCNRDERYSCECESTSYGGTACSLKIATQQKPEEGESFIYVDIDMVMTTIDSRDMYRKQEYQYMLFSGLAEILGVLVTTIGKDAWLVNEKNSLSEIECILYVITPTKSSATLQTLLRHEDTQERIKLYLANKDLPLLSFRINNAYIYSYPNTDPHTCYDSKRTLDESDVDCGGRSCIKRCSADQHCNGNSDCQSYHCDKNGICSKDEDSSFTWLVVFLIALVVIILFVAWYVCRSHLKTELQVIQPSQISPQDEMGDELKNSRPITNIPPAIPNEKGFAAKVKDEEMDEKKRYDRKHKSVNVEMIEKKEGPKKEEAPTPAVVEDIKEQIPSQKNEIRRIEKPMLLSQFLNSSNASSTKSASKSTPLSRSNNESKGANTASNIPDAPVSLKKDLNSSGSRYKKARPASLPRPSPSSGTILTSRSPLQSGTVSSLLVLNAADASEEAKAIKADSAQSNQPEKASSPDSPPSLAVDLNSSSDAASDAASDASLPSIHSSALLESDESPRAPLHQSLSLSPSKRDSQHTSQHGCGSPLTHSEGSHILHRRPIKLSPNDSPSHRTPRASPHAILPPVTVHQQESQEDTGIVPVRPFQYMRRGSFIATTESCSQNQTGVIRKQKKDKGTGI